MSDTVRRNSQNKVTFLLKESQSRLYSTTTVHQLLTHLGERKKTKAPPSWNTSATVALGAPCLVAVQWAVSPYVPLEKLCLRVTPGSHNTITREFILFLPFFPFMKCSEPCQTVELIQPLFWSQKKFNLKLSCGGGGEKPCVRRVAVTFFFFYRNALQNCFVSCF